MYSKVIKNINAKNFLFRFSIFCLALYCLALIFNLFFVPLNLVVGGASGVSIVLQEMTGISSHTLVTIIYIITLILSFIFLDLEKSISLIFCTVLYPFFVNVTSNITDFIQIDYSNMMTICIVSGVLNGIMNGLIYKVGFNSGGLSVIAEILYKRFKISISKANFMINVIVILFGGYYFGVNHILYAIIVMYIVTLMTDKVLLGISKYKYVYIVTNQEEKVHKFITDELHHGVTKLSCETGFMKEKKYVLMCSIPTKDYTILKEGISFIDSRAFMVATDAYQSFGGI